MIIIKIFKYVFYTVIWQYIFNSITKPSFRVLINHTTAQLLTMSNWNIFRFFWSLTFNGITDNALFRVVTLPFGINWNILCDSNYKRFFWIGFTFTLMLYKQYILFKRLFLWPFKLGIFSFVWSIVGFDVSWVLNYFNYFSINIPNWVYLQYFTLYHNWLNWWYDTVKIKSLGDISQIKNNYKENLIPETPSLTESDNTSYLNKKNLVIFLTVITLVGIGVLYYYYSDLSGGSPPTNHQITITDNQTPPVAQTTTTPTGVENPNTYGFNPRTLIEATTSNINNLNNLENPNPWDHGDQAATLKQEGPSSPPSPPSPTGSDDSSDTLTQSNSRSYNSRPMIAILRRD